MKKIKKELKKFKNRVAKFKCFADNVITYSYVDDSNVTHEINITANSVFFNKHKIKYLLKLDTTFLCYSKCDEFGMVLETFIYHN